MEKKYITKETTGGLEPGTFHLQSSGLVGILQQLL